MDWSWKFKAIPPLSILSPQKIKITMELKIKCFVDQVAKM